MLTDYAIKLYDNFNTKGCPDEILFDDFYDHLTPPDYYDFLNDNDENDNNNPGTSVDDVLPENKGVEYEVVPNAPDADANDEEIDDDTLIDDADSLISAIDPLQDEILYV